MSNHNAAYEEQGYRQGYTQGIADGLSKVNIQYTYHSHTTSCQSLCSVDRITVLEDYGYYQASCPLCSERRSCHAECYIQYVHKKCGGTTKEGFLKCGGCGKYFSGSGEVHPPAAGTTTNYTSHSYNSCGKTEDTIESATIIY